MIGTWESDDIKISLDRTAVPGEYIIDAKWSEKPDGFPKGRFHWLHERSVGISTVLDDDNQYSYIEHEPKYDTESCIDSTTHGYFASWAKREEVDRDRNHIRQRRWILDKAFRVKCLGNAYNVDDDRGALTTGGLRYNVLRSQSNPPVLELILYNNVESDLFDYLLTLNHRSLYRDVVIYGKNKSFRIYASSEEDYKLEINNRDYLTEKLDDEEFTYRIGIWGTYQKGTTPMSLEDVIVPDSLPSDISNYKNIREYILDQAQKHQISESDILKAELGLWKKVDEIWEREDLGSTGYWTYRVSLSMDNPEEFFEDLFSEPVEIRMLPCAIYPQFQLNTQCLVKFNTLLTPFSSYLPYEKAYVQNYRKINDKTIAIEAWIKGLAVGEFSIKTSFPSEVREDLLYSTRPAILHDRIARDLSNMQDKIYFNDEAPVMIDTYGSDRTEVLDDLYLRQAPILGYRYSDSEFTDRIVIFQTGLVKLSNLYTMGSRSMKFPMLRKYTLYIPYTDHLTGEVQIQRNGVTVGTIDVDELDYISTFSYERINNGSDVDTSYVFPRYEDGVYRPEVHNATLRGRFYDHTRIKFKDNSGIVIDSSIAINQMVITVAECIGSDRRLVRFNMGTREMLDGDGNVILDEYGQPVICKEPIFYDNRLTKNEVTGEYELSIYIAARCTGSEEFIGFNDCEVKITFDQTNSEGDSLGQATVRYRTVLPPFIVQGIPHKLRRSDTDSVFPDAASRPDIGYYEHGDTYVIPAYSQNSQGYGRDFFFTNGDPLYVIDTSGFMPSNINEEYRFDDVEAHLVNDRTGSKLQLELLDRSSESDTLEVMELDGEPYLANYERSVWIHKVTGPHGRMYKNIVNVSASVFSNPINN